MTNYKFVLRAKFFPITIHAVRQCFAVAGGVIHFKFLRVVGRIRTCEVIQQRDIIGAKFLLRGRVRHLLRRPFLNVRERAFHFIEMPLRVVEQTKMRRRNPFQTMLAQTRETRVPFFKMHFGRRRRRTNVLAALHAHTANVTGKTNVVEYVREMMFRMTGRIEREKGVCADFNHRAIVMLNQLRFGNREKIAPQRLHRVAVNALRARQ